MHGILIVHLPEDALLDPEAVLAACPRIGTGKAIDPAAQRPTTWAAVELGDIHNKGD